MSNHIQNPITEDSSDPVTLIRSASWNLAAINNNPFEYWVTSQDPNYDKIMKSVEEFLSDADKDVRIIQIFTSKMFVELLEEMKENGIGSLEKLREFWENDYSNRLAISGFLKDKAIGTKRLSSMPDRITNTINLADGSICTRPCAISAYQGGSICSVEVWWPVWKKFMFRTEVTIFEDGEKSTPQKVCNLMSPILRSKYPAISVEEQEVSVQLQILCLAILDAIFVFILNASGPRTWEGVKKTLCDSLIYNKASKTSQIIAQSYSGTGIFFIQEAAAIFIQRALENEYLSRKFLIVRPANLDGKRNQNSLILLDRRVFVESSRRDVTGDIVDSLDGVFITAGDLLAVTVLDWTGCGWFLVSFHGDSNGLSTQPVLTAVCELARGQYPDHRLLCGVDANTHTAPPDKFHHHVDSFSTFLDGQGLVSLWGSPPGADIRTTFSCRTYLQTQLNKAVPMADRRASRHHNLKDWILAFGHQVECFSSVERDNTGRRCFTADTVLPSIEFPSDHVIISAALSFPPRRDSQALAPPSAARAPAELARSLSSRVPPPPPPARQDRDRVPRGQRTLYDYWGIGDKPLASAQWAVAGEPRVQGVAADAVPPVLPLDSPQMAGRLAELRERLYRRLVCKPHAGDLDRLNLLMATRADRSIWIVFGQRPFSMGLSKPWFQAVFAGSGLSFLAESMLYVYTALTQSSVRASAFRFVPTRVSTGDVLPLGMSPFTSVGLLQGGVVRVRRGGGDALAGAVVLNLTCEQAIDGFFVEADEGVVGDAVRFRWDRWDSAVGGWAELQFPSWMPKGAVEWTPSTRGPVRAMDFRPPISWVVNRIFALALMSLAFVAGAACGAIEKADLGVYVFAGAFVFMNMSVVWQVATYAAKAGEGGAWIAVSYALHFAANVWHINSAHEQRYQIDLFFVSCSCYFVATLLSYYFAFFPLSQYPWIMWLILITQIFIPMFLSFWLTFLRAFMWSWILGTLVRDDRRAFQTAWDALADERRALDNVKAFCDSLDGTQNVKQPVRQRHRSEAGKFWLRSQAGTRVFPRIQLRGMTEGPPLRSLDQLYDQAVCVDFFLKHKVKCLAQRSNGCLRVESETPRFERWVDIDAWSGTPNEVRVLWAELKPPQRALEKLLRSYDSDVSRLVDCCRESLYFRRCEDLTSCLEAVCADPEVRVVRVKNKLDPDADVYQGGGFRCFVCGSRIMIRIHFAELDAHVRRNVVINLCINTGQTRRLGVEGHICELQLTLTSFAQLVVRSAIGLDELDSIFHQ